jgi:ribonuclease J
MVELKFYGGVNEIGGNKILLEDGDSKIFFDFGQSFNFGEEFFTSWLKPRRLNGLGDYFEFNLLPKIKGVYAREQLVFTDLPYVEPEIDAIFLSHAHFDHINHIQFVDPSIPVYLGEGTKLFLEAMEKTTTFCNYRKHNYETFRTGYKIKIGDLTVEPIHVDHSIPAAYGFLIHTSEGTIVYTGDLRVHGPRKDMTEEFTEKARETEPLAMICEGTRVVEKEERKLYTEQEVGISCDKVVSSTDKIVFFTRYSRDMDRFRNLYNVAVNNNRRIVVSPKIAYLLNRLIEDTRLDLPNPLNDDNILVYFKRKKSGKFDEKDYYVWEREFMDKLVSYQFVHDNQSNLVMDLNFYQFAELIDIMPQANSEFIHSMSEPFSEEDIEDQVMHYWLAHFKMIFHQLHASGHMNKYQVMNLIKNVKPKKVFPVHTENQKLFKIKCRNVQIVKSREEYHL